MILNDDKKIAMISKIAFLYYKKNKNQQEIAELMSIARPTISRLLNEAKDLELVDFNVKYPWRSKDLEKKILSKFKVSEAIVIESISDSDENIIKEIGIAAANYLSPILDKIENIGISWGQSLYTMIDQLDNKNSSVKNVIQMIGATGYENNTNNGPFLAKFLSEKLNSKCIMLHSPLVVENSNIAKSLMNDNNIKNTLEKIESVDIAFVGIGCTDINHNSLYKTGYIDKKELDEIKKSGAVGDICAHYYDKDGKELDIDINSRVIGVNLSQLKNIKKVVAVASGIVKSEATYSALIGEYIDTIIIDSELARSIL